MDNEQLRRSFGLAAETTGVRVRGTVPLSAAAEALRKDDLILQVQGHTIANDGSFAVGAQERLFLVTCVTYVTCRTHEAYGTEGTHVT